MAILSRSVYVLALVDALILAGISFLNFFTIVSSWNQLFVITSIFILTTMFLLGMKGFYQVRQYALRDIYLLFESVFIASLYTSVFESYLEFISLTLAIVSFILVKFK